MKHRIQSFYTYQLQHLNALFRLHFLNCMSYIYSVAKISIFKLLHLLQLLPAIYCSGILCTVNQCSTNQITVIYMHFHCTFTVSISSVLKRTMEKVRITISMLYFVRMSRKVIHKILMYVCS